MKRLITLVLLASLITLSTTTTKAQSPDGFAADLGTVTANTVEFNCFIENGALPLNVMGIWWKGDSLTTMDTIHMNVDVMAWKMKFENLSPNTQYRFKFFIQNEFSGPIEQVRIEPITTAVATDINGAQIVNPTITQLGNQLLISTPANEYCDIFVTNLAGQLVLQTKTNGSTTTVGTDEFSPGMYLITFQQGSSRVTKKIVL